MGTDPDGGFCCGTMGIELAIAHGITARFGILFEVYVTAARVASVGISTAALTAVKVGLPSALRSSVAYEYVDARSGFDKFLDQTAGFAYGLTNALSFGNAPQFVQTNDPQFYRNARNAEIGAHVVSLFQSRGMSSGGQVSYATPSGPVPALRPTTVAPQAKALDVHGRLHMEGSSSETDPFWSQLERQFAKDGASSVRKTLKSLMKRVAKHKSDLPSYQFKSSVEREIRTFEKQIEITQEFMRKHGISLE
jgi:hypothetical protein